jgi:hypothetical protein
MILITRIKIDDENPTWLNNINLACSRVETFEATPEIMEQTYLTFLDLMFALYEEQECEIEQTIEVTEEVLEQRLKFYVNGNEVNEDITQLMLDTNKSLMDNFIEKGDIKENG